MHYSVHNYENTLKCLLAFALVLCLELPFHQHYFERIVCIYLQKEYDVEELYYSYRFIIRVIPLFQVVFVWSLLIYYFKALYIHKDSQ